MLNKYTPDILGNGFEQLRLVQEDDYEGKVVCTLVRKRAAEATTKAFLYIHGFTDYFFQEEFADSVVRQGYNFYALDLRKSGRSILPNHIHYNMRNIQEYYPDVTSALNQIKLEDNTSVIINAHSTGGLLASFYVNSHPGACNGLILNSPFLEINKSWFLRKIAIPFVSIFRHLLPNLKIGGGFSPFYGQSLNADYYGEWVYNQQWKPIRCEYVTLGWLSGIYKAQNQLKKRKINITCPILVLCSSKSIKNRIWIDEFKKADAVLSADDIRKYAPYLGNDITQIDIEGGMHDLILSEKPVREKVYAIMFNWLKQKML